MGFPLLLHLTLLFLLLQPFSSIASLHKFNTLFKSNLSEQVKVNHKLDDEPPMAFFEVKKPIKVPHTQPCIHPILQHEFGHTSDMKQPTFHTAYHPPPLNENCPSQHFSKIVLEWTATCKGRQIGKIFGVWLGGVELLRGCTAEPIPNGIVWTVKKDITKYYSLLTTTETQILTVFLDNIIDETYTGVYDVTITIHFYPVEDATLSIPAMAGHADLILPISENTALNEGFWFRINKETKDTKVEKYTVIPHQNVYTAVLEVYVSFHEDDEHWYANLPQEYIDANEINGIPGNGPFREVVVRIDDQLVGAVWPFTVIYTGGVNPLLWKPVTGIGSFDLPSYDIDITHYLGTMLDGRMHKISFQVTNGLNVWFIDANLHLWRDHKSQKTKVELLKHDFSLLELNEKPVFEGLKGKFMTTAKRSGFSSGLVHSYHGLISSRLSQQFEYGNSMIIENDGNSRKVKQYIIRNQNAYELHPTSNVPYLTQYWTKFEISLEINNVNLKDNTYSSQSKLELSIQEVIAVGNSRSSFTNQQSAGGTMLFNGDNILLKASGNTEQTYDIRSSESCYWRIHSQNYIILHEEKRGC